MSAVLKIMRYERVLSSKVFEGFTEVQADDHFLEIDHLHRKILPNLRFCLQSW